MKRLLLALALASLARAQAINPDKRLEHATSALRAFLNAESPIPKDLVGKSQCIVVAPALMKGAFLAGEKYGRGFASCRKPTGGWSSPAAIAMEGEGFGLKLAGTSADLVLLVMSTSGMNRLLDDKFALGRETAAGTIGANTDALKAAETISYSRSKGQFAGIPMEGTTLRPDGGENKKLYGRELSNRDILSGKIAPPKGTRAFVSLLVKHAKKAR